MLRIRGCDTFADIDLVLSVFQAGVIVAIDLQGDQPISLPSPSAPMSVTSHAQPQGRMYREVSRASQTVECLP